MTVQEILRLLLYLSPIFLIQASLAIYSLVDLSKRQQVRGKRWLWAVLLVVSAFALPSGLLVTTLYMMWGRQSEVKQ